MNRRHRLKRLLTTRALGRYLLIPVRLGTALGYYKKPLADLVRWLFTSRELGNFTYDLDDLNKAYLASFVSVITGVEWGVARDYITELEQDQQLASHIRRLTSIHPERWVADTEAKYGRRLGWYAFVRAKKPNAVIETGAAKGLGSCVIAAALMRNEQEGFDGYLYSTDINPRAGVTTQATPQKYKG